MGMFDWINHKCDCPKCGRKLEHFQSKEGNCTLEEIEPWQVSYFYGSCPECKTWLGFDVSVPCKDMCVHCGGRGFIGATVIEMRNVKSTKE